MRRHSLSDPLAPWADKLPADWDCTRVDDVADVLFSNVDKQTSDDEEAVRLCNYVDVYKNERITRYIDFMEASAEPREIMKFQLRRGDVLSTKDSETADDIAISAVVADELPGVLCGYHLALMRPRSHRIHGPYLAWLHASKQFRAQYEARAVGVTRFGLPQYAFRAARIALPPVREQRLIAAFLDQSCKALDDAVTAKREQLARIDGVRESTIERTVKYGLDRKKRLHDVDRDWIVSLPSHWSAVRIKRLLSRMDYGISESTERDGRYPVLKMGNIQGGEIKFTNIEFVETVEDDLILETDDILYNRTNSADQVGKAAIFRGSKSDGVTFASYLVRLRANHRILPSFLNYVVNSFGFLSFARKLAIPSVQQSNLNSTRYGRIFVPLPPLGEQREICAYLDEEIEKLSALASTIEAQIETLVAYRKSLIYEYVTGQRRVPVEQEEKAAAYG